MTLGHVLRFITGTDEEPVLGFKMQPSIEFCENSLFFPTFNNCVNSLKFVRGSLTTPFPSDAELFQILPLGVHMMEMCRAFKDDFQAVLRTLKSSFTFFVWTHVRRHKM